MTRPVRTSPPTNGTDREWKPTDDLPLLVLAALERDEAAWKQLVERLSGVVWHTIGAYGLSSTDRDEVFASTFFRLFENLSHVREPKALPAWIATTARNEAHALFRSKRRLVPTDDLPVRDLFAGDHDESLLDNELLGVVIAAFNKLSPKAQSLLRLLTAVPSLQYNEISKLLDIPMGSIGPLRQRYLHQLRTALVPYLSDGTL